MVRLASGLALVAALGWGQTAAAAAPVSRGAAYRAPLQIALPPPHTVRLENGLSVVLQRDGRVGEVSLSMRYGVGSLDDPPGYTGLAHLVEHMTFRGSRHLRSLEAFSALERVGATSINGVTGPLDTTYFSTLPVEQVETALWIESERMAFTLEKLSEANLTLERRIVKDEMRQKEGFDFETHVLRALFPPGHQYHPQWFSFSDLEAVRLRDVQWFFQRWYRPDNATLVLSGDVDEARLVPLIEKYFGPVVAPRKPLPARVQRPISLSVVRRVIVAAPVTPERMTFVWVAQKPKVTDVAMLSFASFILGQRLQRKLVTDARVAQAVGVEVQSLGDSLMFWVDIVMLGSPDYRRTEVLVADAVRKLQNEPVEHRSLEEARSRFATGLAANYALLPLRLPVSPGRLLQAGLDADAAALTSTVRRYLPLGRCLVAALTTSSDAPYRGEIVQQWDTP